MSKVRHPGWLVWNPDGDLPKVVHKTYGAAEAEAERLSAAHPSRTFVVMAPVRSAKGKIAEKAFSDGKVAGAAEMHMDVIHAEAAADRLKDKNFDLANDLRKFRPILADARSFQTVVADALLWFDGFSAAYALKEEWERPRIPDRRELRDLNAALMDLITPVYPDDEIPF